VVGTEPGGVGVLVEFPSDDGGSPWRRRFAHDVTSSDSSISLLRLGHALTLHRAQGSEWDSVVVFVPSLPGRLSTWFNRRLLYTAVTRARRRLLVVGDLDTLRAACAQPAPPRPSRLAEALQTALA
jgi:ATP-dependent exoDNAse (exonuclease V) alpha subunit